MVVAVGVSGLSGSLPTPDGKAVVGSQMLVALTCPFRALSFPQANDSTFPHRTLRGGT